MEVQETEKAQQVQTSRVENFDGVTEKVGNQGGGNRIGEK